MKLYLIRHAEAISMCPDHTDSERWLTKAGKHHLQRNLGAWKRLELSFDHVLCSPYLRARQTARLIRKKGFFHTKLTVLDALTPDGNVADILAHIQAYSSSDSLAIVSHNPIMTELAHRLLALPHLCFSMAPATLAGLDITSWEPRPLATLAVYI